MPYSPTTFVNGGPPGISASYLNGVELMLASINSAATDASISASAGVLSPLGLNVGAGLTMLTPHTTTKNGSTSGTMTVSEYFYGGTSLKIVLVNFFNYKNAGGANDVTLNQAFTSGAQLWSGFVQGLSFKSGGSAQGISIVTSFGTSGDGSSSTFTKIFSHSIGLVGAFDTISEGGGNALSRSGQMFIAGY